MNKHILLASYVFPPYPDIGSRRWAKFAKYLARDGFNVHVVAARNPFKEQSLWTADIKHENIYLHYLPHCYPKILMSQRKFIWQKIIARILICLLRMLVKGIIFDYAIFWQKPLEKKVISLIKTHGIKNIIVTGPPFRVPYYITRLKTKFPGLDIISDLRDIWLNGRVYCLDGLSGKVLEYEAGMEDYAVRNSSYLTFPDENITFDFRNRYSAVKSADKFITLTHAYDADNYIFDIPLTAEPGKKQIELVFGGSIPMKDIEPIIIPLFECLSLLKQDMPQLYGRLSFKFYVRQYWFFTLAKKYGLEAISICSPVPEKEYFHIIRRMDFFMIFLPDHLKDYRTTKFPEYLPLKKPIVVFSNPGKTSQYVIENKIGSSFTPGNYYNNMIQMVKEYDAGRAVFNPDFNYERFSYSSVTKDLESLFRFE